MNELFALAQLASLHAHEETGNAATYARDRAVGQWCRQRQVRWAELPQFGVVRRLANHDHWLRHWEAHMRAHCHDLPEVNASHFQPGPWAQKALPDATALGLDAWVPPQRQRGGRKEGEAVLQATRAQMSRVNASNSYAAKGLAAFLSRLHWHCHFIQKLESEPELVWRNVHRGYDGLREPDWNPAHFEALTQGRTGWPMVDACVAMLVSVAAYPLWLHWREVGLWLARGFLDYEPGIHWSQLQMQSGTTGINTTRVYNPVKQALDQEPKGFFVRRWLPALRRMPESVQMACGVRVSADAPAGAPDACPMPVVDLAENSGVGRAKRPNKSAGEPRCHHAVEFGL